MPTGGIDIGIGAALTDAVGATAGGLIADAGVGALGGAALGGLEGEVTGGNVGKGIVHGAEGGALTGGGIGLGGDVFGSSLGATAADALGGAAGGALGAEVTGGKPITGALEGAASGGIAGALASSGAPSTASATGGAGPSAGGAAAPSGVQVDTSGIDTLASGGGVSGTDLSTVGSPSTSGTNVGSGTVGTQNLPSGLGNDVGSQFAQAAGGAPTLNSTGIDTLAAGGGASGTGAGTSSPTSIDNFLAKPGAGTAFDVVKANPGAAISAAGIGLDALRSGHQTGAEKNLEAEASQLGQQGTQLEGYLQSGSLPPGLQAGVNQASEAAKATIRSQYAAQGASGSSAEQQDLAAVDSRAQAQGAQMALQLMQTGISETGMASKLYDQLLGQETQEDSTLGSAISNFASAAAGGGQAGRGGITVNYPQA